MVKSLTLNFYMSLFNLKLAPIFGQQISILDPLPLTLDFLVRLGLNFHPMCELRLGRRHIFLSRTDRNVTTYVVPRSVREARQKCNGHKH